MAFSLQAGSSLACCDNAHRGRADVLCQQHICIHPQSPPLHWPDNGAALLLPFHLNQKKKKRRKRRREKGELLSENQCPLYQELRNGGIKLLFKSAEAHVNVTN